MMKKVTGSKCVLKINGQEFNAQYAYEIDQIRKNLKSDIEAKLAGGALKHNFELSFPSETEKFLEEFSE